jgi:hypothetical protein
MMTPSIQLDDAFHRPVIPCLFRIRKDPQGWELEFHKPAHVTPGAAAADPERGCRGLRADLRAQGRKNILCRLGTEGENTLIAVRMKSGGDLVLDVAAEFKQTTLSPAGYVRLNLGQ